MFGRERTTPDGESGPITRDHLALMQRIMSYTPRSWILGLVALAALSVVDISSTAGGLRVRVHVTSLTILLVAFIWLPALLTVLAIGGARLKVPAGELETMGLLEFLRSNESEPLTVHGSIAVRLRDLEVRYEALREVLPHGDQRTVLLEAIMLQARAVVQSAEEGGELDRRLVGFEEGGDGSRAVTLGLLQATTATSVRMVECVANAIIDPRSAFEQYHALRAAQTLLPRVSSLLQSRLVHAVQRAADSGGMSQTGYRSTLVRQILGIPR